MLHLSKDLIALMLNFINFVKILLKRYFIDSFFLITPQVLAISVALITLPIILANLPIKDYGIFQFVLALQLWLSTLTAGYITSGAKRGIAKGLDGTFLFAFFSRLKYLVIVGLISFVISFFIYNIGLITLSLLLIIAGVFLMLGYLPQVSYPEFFIAKKQFRNFAVWNTFVGVLVPIASAVSAFLTHNIFIFAIVQFGSITLISWLGFLYVVCKNNLFSAYKKNEIDKECVPYGIKLIPASLILQTSNKITNFIIGPVFGFADLAMFSVACKLEEKFRGFIKASHNLIYADFAKNEQEELIRKLKANLKKGLVVSIILTLGYIFGGYLYLDLFLPGSYQTTKFYFLILSLGLPGIILQTITHTILAVNLRHRELTVLIILPSLIKIALIILLGVLFGIVGICWSIVLAAWISFGFYYSLALKGNVWRDLCSMAAGLKKYFS